MQEGPVRPAVDDVERRLEHAEQRQRRPEERGTADDPERRRVVLHSVDEADDLVDRGSGKGLLDLLHDEGRFVGSAGETEERERQKSQRDERQQREIRDHRRQVSPPVGEELARQVPPAHSHLCGVSLCFGPSWTSSRRSPT